MLKKLVRDENGAALVEYGILIALIALLCIAAVAVIGTQVSTAFSNMASALQANF